jgi:hypothetical protein
VAVGVLLKLVPVVLVPASFLYFRTLRRRVVYAAVLGLVLVAGLLPLLAKPEARANLATFAEVSARRAPWETVWALAVGYTDFAAVAPPPPVEQYRIDDLMRLRFQRDLSFLDWQRAYSNTGLTALQLVLVAGVLVVLCVAGRPPDARNLVDRVVFTTAGFFLAMKGWSPQYAAFWMPLLILLVPGPRGVGLALALAALTFVEMPIWLCYLKPVPAVGVPVLAAVILARTGLFLWVATFSARRYLRGNSNS